MGKPFQNTLIILSVLALAFLYAHYQRQRVMDLQDSSDGVLMVSMLPKFSLELLDAGDRITDEGLHADGVQLLVVHFWATWCPPCLPEVPELLQFARHFADNPQIKFLLIAVRDERAKIRKWLKKMGKIPPNVFLALDSEGGVMTAFGTVKVPETHYYFKRRSIKRLIGPQNWQNTYFSQEIEKLF